MFLDIQGVLVNVEHISYVDTESRTLYLLGKKKVVLSEEDFEEEYFYLMNYLNDNELVL